MSDKLTVINRALGFLGERTIVDPNAPDTPPGRHIAGIFIQARREVLRVFPWNFAEVWVEVDKTTAPAFGYADAYVLPSDFLRLLIVGYSKVSTSEKPPLISRRDYRLLYQPSPNFRRVIAIDNSGEAKLKIAYTADVDLLHLWDALALKVFSLWLAFDAAKAITGQDIHVKTLNGLLTEALRDAAGVDGNEQAIRLHIESNVQRERNLSQYGDMIFTPVKYTV